MGGTLNVRAVCCVRHRVCFVQLSTFWEMKLGVKASNKECFRAKTCVRGKSEYAFVCLSVKVRVCVSMCGKMCENLFCEQSLSVFLCLCGCERWCVSVKK